jgi:hypothetical protein
LPFQDHQRSKQACARVGACPSDRFWSHAGVTTASFHMLYAKGVFQDVLNVALEVGR